MTTTKRQQQIADETGLHFSTIYHVFRNPWRVSWNTYKKVAKNIGILENEAHREWVSSKIKHGEKRLRDKYYTNDK